MVFCIAAVVLSCEEHRPCKADPGEKPTKPTNRLCLLYEKWLSSQDNVSRCRAQEGSFPFDQKSTQTKHHPGLAGACQGSALSAASVARGAQAELGVALTCTGHICSVLASIVLIDSSCSSGLVFVSLFFSEVPIYFAVLLCVFWQSNAASPSQGCAVLGVLVQFFTVSCSRRIHGRLRVLKECCTWIFGLGVGSARSNLWHLSSFLGTLEKQALV